MIKVAVTGATGVLGRHVVRELNRLPVRVIAAAHSGHSDLPVLTDGWWLEMDLANPSDNMYEKLGQPDVLIHLAWQGLPRFKSMHHFETELPLQYRFLKDILKAGLPSIVVAGTCLEYGMRNGIFQETMPTNPSNPYAYAKDSLYKQLVFAKGDLNFNLTWARLFYMYGDGQSSTTLYSQLKQTVQQSERLFNMSAGAQLRDYLPIETVSRYLVKLALLKKDIGIVNVCSGRPQSVRSLVEGWVEKNNWNIELNLGYYPYPDYEPMAFWGDNSNLKTLIS